MGRYDALVDLLIEVAKDGKKKVDSDFVPIGVSNRHVHLSKIFLNRGSLHVKKPLQLQARRVQSKRFVF